MRLHLDVRFFHPQMIAQCADKPGPSLEQMIDFVLAALVPRGKTAQKKKSAPSLRA